MSQQDEKTCRKLISILEDLIAQKNWDETLLLQASKKKIIALKEEAERFLAKFKKLDVEEQKQTLQTEGMIPIYILIHNSDGYNLQAWHQIVKALSQRITGRPIYAKLEHAKRAILAKDQRQKEGYVEVYVRPEELIVGGRPDHLGQPLVNLKQGKVPLGQIVSFSHQGEDLYQIGQGELVQRDEA